MCRKERTNSHKLASDLYKMEGWTDGWTDRQMGKSRDMLEHMKQGKPWHRKREEHSYRRTTSSNSEVSASAETAFSNTERDCANSIQGCTLYQGSTSLHFAYAELWAGPQSQRHGKRVGPVHCYLLPQEICSLLKSHF